MDWKDLKKDLMKNWSPLRKFWYHFTYRIESIWLKMTTSKKGKKQDE